MLGTLTYLSSPYYLALFRSKRLVTRRSFEELHKPVGLLDRNLCQLAMLMKDMEQVSLSHLLSG
jgi:hypothetical protein